MSNPFLGEIKIFGFGFVPRNYAACNGALVGINNNAALFSILGTTYGGNGTSNFALPNMQGRAPIHRGQSAGTLNYTLGQTAGVEAFTLSFNEMPAHSHQFFGSAAPANRRPVEGGTFAADQVADVDYLAPFNATNSSFVGLGGEIAPAGGNQPHNNMQPYAVTNFCIAMAGSFPSRN